MEEPDPGEAQHQDHVTPTAASRHGASEPPQVRTSPPDGAKLELRLGERAPQPGDRALGPSRPGPPRRGHLPVHDHLADLRPAAFIVHRRHCTARSPAGSPSCRTNVTERGPPSRTRHRGGSAAAGRRSAAVPCGRRGAGPPRGRRRCTSVCSGSGWAAAARSCGSRRMARQDDGVDARPAAGAALVTPPAPPHGDHGGVRVRQSRISRTRSGYLRSMNIAATLAAAAVATAVAVRAARSRDRRFLHPDGRSFTGDLEIWGALEPTGAGLLDRPGRHPVTLRISKGSGTRPGRADILGVALRVHGPVAGRRHDLLFSTAGRGRVLRHVPVPRRSFDTAYGSILPYRSGSGRTFHLGVQADPDGEPLGRTLGRSSRRPGTTARDCCWRADGDARLGRMRFGAVLPATPDAALAFDPVRNTTRGPASDRHRARHPRASAYRAEPALARRPHRPRPIRRRTWPGPNLHRGRRRRGSAEGDHHGGLRRQLDPVALQHDARLGGQQHLARHRPQADRLRRPAPGWPPPRSCPRRITTYWSPCQTSTWSSRGSDRSGRLRRSAISRR